MSQITRIRVSIFGFGRMIGGGSSCPQREWHGLLFLRNPAALRDGLATRALAVAQPR